MPVTLGVKDPSGTDEESGADMPGVLGVDMEGDSGTVMPGLLGLADGTNAVPLLARLPRLDMPTDCVGPSIDESESPGNVGALGGV